MYDPVRDSVASSSPAASPSHRISGVRPEDRKPLVIPRDSYPPYASVGYVGTAADAGAALDDGDDTHNRVRILRGLSQRQSYDSLGIADRTQLGGQVSGTGRAGGSSAVCVPGAGSEVGVAVEERPGGSSHDYYHGAVTREESAYDDAKGKSKAMVSQSPAFRLDNLLEPNTQEHPKPPSGADDDYERLEPHTDERGESSYTFTGKLPPPPHIGPSAAGSSTHTSMDYLGISVSKDVNLGRFALPDDFEKAIFASTELITDATGNALPGTSRFFEPPPNAKRARKHVSTSQRRKTRGLFPQDNVPLAISTTTSKQSRYRPSGDRQPVACGYRDPITQIQCDEPFNRSVELRRHVRAVHVPAEALAVTMGQLSRAQATLLPADWKPGDGDVLRPKCLCGKEFSRLDALRRHWTGVQAEVIDGKCISCPSSLGKRKDHAAFEQGIESAYGAPLYS